MWTLNGVGVCTDGADQSTPQLVTDMNGGAIVAWSDWRSGIERDLYAQRVDSNGVIQWTYNGAVVSNKVEREHNERMISDGAGGVIVVWEQQRTTDYTWDIWAQRISSTGTTLWVAGGLPVVVENANRINPRIQADGKGGVLMAWEDFRNGVDYDIYGQHLDKNGNRLWGSAGKTICAIGGTQINPKVDPDSISGGIYVVWSDTRMGPGYGYDLYAQLVDSAGNSLWTSDGVQVSGAANNQTAPDLLSNKLTDGLIVTWKDNRAGNYDIYAQKLNRAGVSQWFLNGIVICNAAGQQVNPNIASDNMGGAIIAWQDSTASDWDVRSQRVSSTGTVMWTANGEWVATAADEQSSPKNISDGNSGAIYCWQDHRTGTFDIYAHHLYADGSPLLSQVQPAQGGLAAAWPNPFAENLHLKWEAGVSGAISVKVMDLTGRWIKEIPTELVQREGSICELTLDAVSFFPVPGIYFVELNTGDQTQTLKVVRVAE